MSDKTETQIKVPHTKYREIAKRRKAGETLKSIAGSYNVTRERIRQILRDHFPEITATIAGRTRREIFDRERKKQTQFCACGCKTTIPKWKRNKWGWSPAPRYASGHQGRNRVPYKRTPIDRVRISVAQKKNWATGKYDNKIRKDTIITRQKLWKVLKEHPEGLTVREIIKITGIKVTTLLRWIKIQQYIKLDVYRSGGQGHPYIIKLAKELPVNLEDEICSSHLNLGIKNG